MPNLKLNIGDVIPPFSAPDETGKIWTNKSLMSSKTILYFYPKDNTPGCTQEACDFRDFYIPLQKKGGLVLGVSKDSSKSHEGFKKKFSLPFPLLSDTDGKMCQDFGVWIEKSMYGKKYFGIERATFLLNEQGIILSLWQPVKVPGHIEEVLSYL